MSAQSITTCILCGESVTITSEETDPDGAKYHGEFDCRNGHEGVIEITTPRKGLVDPTAPQPTKEEEQAAKEAQEAELVARAQPTVDVTKEAKAASKK